MAAVPTVVDRVVGASDGRTLVVQEGGDSDGRPVLVHGGSPNSRLLYPPDVALAARQGIRLISYDRPGYGGSTRQPERIVSDCVQDVRAIAAALGIERLAIIGGSGGGPHALACGALLPDLVVAVAALASVAPYGSPDLDYYDGMGELNIEDTRLLLEDPVAARAKCERDREEMLLADADSLMEFLRTLLSPADTEVLTGELVEFVVTSTRAGLAPGADGWWDDGLALVGSWGFDLDSIAVPVLLRHGRQDRFVPFAHGEWFARHIPAVDALLTDDDGHLTLTVRHLESINAWLLSHFP
jgi:pimeloyl-ACP methyl ester carboxylesterase